MSEGGVGSLRSSALCKSASPTVQTRHFPLHYFKKSVAIRVSGSGNIVYEKQNICHHTVIMSLRNLPDLHLHSKFVLVYGVVQPTS